MITKATSMTSIKVQDKLHYKLQQRVINDGYGMRGKSKWIAEAIESFLKLPDYPTLADIAGDMVRSKELITIRLSDHLRTQLERAIIETRRHYPAMEGVKSNLIRASILQRLIRQTTSVTEA